MCAAYLVERPIPQADPNNDRKTKTDLSSRCIFVDLCPSISMLPFQCPSIAHKIDLNLFDSAGPPVESKDLVREVDALFRCEIVHLLARWSRP